jgi:hypothetical protein
MTEHDKKRLPWIIIAALIGILFIDNFDRVGTLWFWVGLAGITIGCWWASIVCE